MKTPNYDDTKGKHPIPHAKGIAKDDNLNPKSVSTEDDEKKSEKEK
ncbi:hypothetical protein [Nonlabens antarcticus]|nr:hypothetical protein [Nonlabens antarcticus]